MDYNKKEKFLDFAEEHYNAKEFKAILLSLTKLEEIETYEFAPAISEFEIKSEHSVFAKLVYWNGYVYKIDSIDQDHLELFIEFNLLNELITNVYLEAISKTNGIIQSRFGKIPKNGLLNLEIPKGRYLRDDISELHQNIKLLKSHIKSSIRGETENNKIKTEIEIQINYIKKTSEKLKELVEKFKVSKDIIEYNEYPTKENIEYAETYLYYLGEHMQIIEDKSIEILISKQWSLLN